MGVCFNENGPSKCTSGANYICISVLRVTLGNYCHMRPVYKGSSDQAPFVQRLDSTINRINHTISEQMIDDDGRSSPISTHLKTDSADASKWAIVLRREILPFLHTRG